MGDVRGQVYALTVLTPIVPGREEQLRAAIQGLGAGPASPLAMLEATHFARWVMLPELYYGARPQKPDSLNRQQLLFTSNLDGSVHEYLREMAERMPDAADAVWSNCEDYPGAEDHARFSEYLMRHRVRTGLVIAPYPEKTVPQVRSALDARERLIEFCFEHADRDAPALQKAFLAAFPGGAP